MKVYLKNVWACAKPIRKPHSLLISTFWLFLGPESGKYQCWQLNVVLYFVIHSINHLVLNLWLLVDWPWRCDGGYRLVCEGGRDRHANKRQTLLLYLQTVAGTRQGRWQNSPLLLTARWRQLHGLIQTK